MTTSGCKFLFFLPVPRTDTVVIIKTNIGQLLSITCNKIIITRSEKKNFLVICNVDDKITMILTLPWSLGKQRAVSLWVQSRYNIYWTSIKQSGLVNWSVMELQVNSDQEMSWQRELLLSDRVHVDLGCTLIESYHYKMQLHVSQVIQDPLPTVINRSTE